MSLSRSDLSAAGTALDPVPGDDRLDGITNLRVHTARGMLINGGYQIGLVVLGGLRGVIAAAFLSQSDFGVWGLVGLALFTALGLKDTFGASEKYIQQSAEDQELAFQRAFTIEAIMAAAAIPVMVAIIVLFALISGYHTVLAPGFALLLMLPSTVLQFPIAAFYRRMDFRLQRTLQSFDAITGTAVTIVLAILGAGYWSLVLGMIAGSWAGAIAALRVCPYRLAFRYDGATLRNYLVFSGPLLIGALAVAGMFQALYFTGSAALGIAGLGAFTLVGNIVQLTDRADAIVTETLYPGICAVQDRLERLAEIFVKSNRLALMWAVPFGIGLTLFGSDLIRYVIGTQWLAAVPLLQIMGVVTAVHHVGYNWYAFFKARGSTKEISVLSLVGVAVVLGAGIPLMYSEHLVGLGYAFAIAEALGFVLRGALLARFFRGFRILRHLLRAFAPTLFAAAAVLGARSLGVHEDDLFSTAAVFALYLAINCAATLVFERTLLREAVGYVAGRAPQAQFA